MADHLGLMADQPGLMAEPRAAAVGGVIERMRERGPGQSARTPAVPPCSSYCAERAVRVNGVFAPVHSWVST